MGEVSTRSSSGGGPDGRTTAEIEAAIEEASTRPDVAPLYMVQAALGFTEQLERIGEVALMLVVGALLAGLPAAPAAGWFVPLLLLVVRPLAVYAGLAGAPVTGRQKALAAWFGVRGVGSLYYLAFALTHGLPPALAPLLLGLTLWTVAASVAVATPV